MWFEDESGIRRRPFGRRDRVLYANVRIGGRRGAAGADRTRLFVLLTAVGVAVIVVGWLAWRWAGEALFSKNSVYKIVNLEIRGGGDLVAYFIREKKGIREGSNLFAVDVGNVRDEFLRQRYASKYKSMEITRILPDTLRVDVVERVPLARVGRRGTLMADDDGFVFSAGASTRQNLPVLTGYSGAPLRPGDRLQDGPMDAITVLDLCEKTGVGREVTIGEVNVRGGFAGKRDDLQLLLDGPTEVLLWWPRRDSQLAAPREDLRERLLFLRAILLRARQDGRRLKKVNLTLESYQNNCPVTFY